jgi:hypothetical protein
MQRVEQESEQMPETQPNPQYDALLVHGYWMSEPTPGNVRLALRSRLAVRAAALAYNGGKGAGKIVIDLSHLWGPNYPTEGSLMAKELEDKYSIPHEAIILREGAYSTGGEVKSFVTLAKENGWEKLMDVAFSNHHLTIPRIYREYKNEALVEYKSVEDILREKDDHLVTQLTKRLEKSRYGKTYRLYERAKWLRMHMPGFNYDSLETKNKNSRKDKGKEFILPVDIYKL